MQPQFESDKYAQSKLGRLSQFIANELTQALNVSGKSKEEIDKLQGQFIIGIRSAIDAPDFDEVNRQTLTELIADANKVDWNNPQELQIFYDRANEIANQYFVGSHKLTSAIRSPEDGNESWVHKGVRFSLDKRTYNQIDGEIKSLKEAKVDNWAKIIAGKFGKDVALIQAIEHREILRQNR